MIKALLLIFDPIATWEGIVQTQRKWIWILLGYLFPLWIVVSAAEAFGLVHWGKPRGQVSHIEHFSRPEAIAFEVLQFILSLCIVFIGARLIKALGDTFHGRHTFNQTFTVTAYGLGPLFLLRVADAFPGISPWITWGIGIVLCFAILYTGIPIVMQPDPPHAFGLYLTSGVLLTLVSGLIRFLTAWYLAGRFTKLDALISHIVGSFH